MLNVKEMKQEIEDFCIKLILDSELTDWDKKSMRGALFVDNIVIFADSNQKIWHHIHQINIL